MVVQKKLLSVLSSWSLEKKLSFVFLLMLMSLMRSWLITSKITPTEN